MPLTRVTADSIVRLKADISRDLITSYYDAIGSEQSEDEADAKKSLPIASLSLLRPPRSVQLSDFDLLPGAVIGCGAFGIIQLCRMRGSGPQAGKVYAMKTLSTSSMIQRGQIRNVLSERSCLVSSKLSKSPWMTALNWSFQDRDSLHFVFEFVQGGDLMYWLMQMDTFPEAVARFYVCELLLAIDILHKAGFVHRDIKPDNILLETSGHLKLTDFGLSIPLESVNVPTSVGQATPSATADPVSTRPNDVMQPVLHPSTHSLCAKDSPTRRHFPLKSLVGSPGYTSPEVLLCQGHNSSVDLWAIGVCAFEMLCGYVPFPCDTPAEATACAADWRKYLVWPAEIDISPLAKDFVHSLLQDKEYRLTAEEALQHPWIVSSCEGVVTLPQPITSDSVRLLRPPIIPAVTSDDDTRYFESPEQASRSSTLHSAEAAAISEACGLQHGAERGPLHGHGTGTLFYGFGYSRNQANKVLHSRSHFSRISKPSSTSTLAAS